MQLGAGGRPGQRGGGWGGGGGGGGGEGKRVRVQRSLLGGNPARYFSDALLHELIQVELDHLLALIGSDIRVAVRKQEILKMRSPIIQWHLYQ